MSLYYTRLNNDDYGEFSYLPYNADTEDINATCVEYSLIKKTIENMVCKRLFFLDTCHSGNVLGTTRRDVVDLKGAVNDLTSAGNGSVVFAASTGQSYSQESDLWHNGAFTKALVEGITGAADYNHDGTITVDALGTYIAHAVNKLTGGTQKPTTAKPKFVPDFPIAVKRE